MVTYAFQVAKEEQKELSKIDSLSKGNTYPRAENNTNNNISPR